MRGMQRAETLLGSSMNAKCRVTAPETNIGIWFNPSCTWCAYGKIYRNDGSMTPGVNAETGRYEPGRRSR